MTEYIDYQYHRVLRLLFSHNSCFVLLFGQRKSQGNEPKESHYNEICGNFDSGFLLLLLLRNFLFVGEINDKNSMINMMIETFSSHKYS